MFSKPKKIISVKTSKWLTCGMVVQEAREVIHFYEDNGFSVLNMEIKKAWFGYLYAEITFKKS